jgi:hypothetical protein
MESKLEIGFELDRRWRLLRGEMEGSKKSDLVALARVLAEARIPYAVIGGVALQVHQREPRTTLDIDVALASLRSLPRDALAAGGFQATGTFSHSENWVGPDATPVQFTDDAAFSSALSRATTVDVGGVPLRVLAKADLLREKLRAGADPARRKSKRMQDLADAQALVEDDPALAQRLSDAEKKLLATLP